MDTCERGPGHAAGKEIFEIKPVILGGDPIDPKNKVLLSREEHIEAVRYWNRLIRDIRGHSGHSEQVADQ